MKKTKIVLVTFIIPFFVSAQVFDPGFQAFIEAYVGYDFNQPNDANRPLFISNHHRVNEPAINLALVEYGYVNKEDFFRGKLGLMAGTYVQRNLATEPIGLQHISEAYAGVHILGKAWLDVGVFNSHIGYEGIKGIDNDMLTRWITSELTPYYESGVRVVRETEHFTFAGLILNGWQQIQRKSNQATAPSLGTQIQWKNSNWKLNSSLFIGNIGLQTSSLHRFFHDAWACYSSTNQKHKFILVADFARDWIEQDTKQTWTLATFMYKYQALQHWAFSARLENYYSWSNPSSEQFKLSGAAMCAEYKPLDQGYIRFETRYLGSNYSLYSNDMTAAKNSFWIGAAIGFRIKGDELKN